MLRISALLVAALGCAPLATAQLLIMPDSTSNQLVAFSPVDGSPVLTNIFALAGGTPIAAIDVNGEVWISEQIGDRIVRYDFATGAVLGVIGPTFPGGGLDNIRGIARVGNEVYVTNAGTANTSFGNGVIRFDLNGNYIAHVVTTGTSGSPFSVLPFGNDILVASSSAANDIHRYDLNIASIGMFHDSTSLNFAHQMALASDGNVWCAGFSSNNVVKLDAQTGAVLVNFPASGARGVHELANGNVLWTSGTGVHVYDLVAMASTTVHAGGGRHLNLYGSGSVALASRYGTGCGAVGQPALALGNTGRPQIGTTMSIDVTNLPASAIFGYVAFGFQRLPMALPLDGLGMPGCTQYIAPDANLFFLVAGASHGQPFALPADPAFSGLELETQGLAFAPGANAMGVLTSNGMQLRLGQQ